MNPYLVLVVLAAVIVGAVVVGVRLMLASGRQRREAAAKPRRLSQTASEYYTRTLRQAVEVAGSEAELAATLDVPPEALRRWLAGEEPPPVEVHLAALDLVTRGTPQAEA